jgi:indolepyruvate decarboxylase
MTAQELSTILRRGLKPIIFLINNNGYTIERLILGPGSSYNDINQWRYAEAASFFDTQVQTVAYRVRTEDELEDALAAARDRETFMLIELKMNRLDAPGPLVNFAQRCAEFNFPSAARFDNPAHEESSEAPQQRLSGVQSRQPSEAIGQRAYNSQKADH